MFDENSENTFEYDILEAKLNLNSAIEKIEVAKAQKDKLEQLTDEDSLKEDKGFQKLL